MKRGGYGSGGFNETGGSATGPVLLFRDPVEPLEAVTKAYFYSALNNISATAFKTGTIPESTLPAFGGDISNTAGSNVLILKPSGVTAGTYSKVRVDTKGRVITGYNLAAADLPDISWTKITTGKPTTLGSYGIADALTPVGGTLTGLLKVNTTPTDPLHVVNKAYVDTLAAASTGGLSTGDIIKKLTATTPNGFLRCNGGEVSKTTYSALYSVIGDTFSYTTQQGAGQPWRRQYDINLENNGDITDWTTGTALPGVLSYSQAIVTKNRVYLLGGYTTSYVSTVYTAPINSDGTLGTWTTGTSLLGALRSSQAIVTKNRVYLLGGYTNNYVSTVYTAPINPDGTLGTWGTGTSLPGALAHSQAIVTKNRVYLLGGENSSYVSTVYTAPINSDGTLGTWTTGTLLPGVLGASQAIVTKNRVYLLGGYTGSVYVSTVYTAPINSDGTLGTWKTGTSLPGALGQSQAIVTKNRVYLLGGNDAGYDSTVYTAPINSDGTLGTWATGTSLPGSLGASQAIVTKNRVYLLGGSVGNSVSTSTVFTASINGGLNDYSPYYDGTIISTDTANFRLPDYTTKELPGSYTYIKT